MQLDVVEPVRARFVNHCEEPKARINRIRYLVDASAPERMPIETKAARCPRFLLVTAIEVQVTDAQQEVLVDDVLDIIELDRVDRVGVRDQVRAHTHADILKLYEQWIAQPDRITAEKLAELGVTPMRPGKDA